MGLIHDLMDDLKKIKIRKPQEVPVEATQAPLNFRIETIKNIQDAEKIVEHIKQGDILLVRSKIPSMEEYKNAVKILKDACTEVNSEIVGFGENNLIITPANINLIK